MNSSVFQFSARERAGIFLLCSITLAAFLLPHLLEPPPKIPTNQELIVWEAYDSLYESQKQKYDSVKRSIPTESNARSYFNTTAHREAFEKKPNHRFQAQPTPIDINKADSALWESLPGIGPGFASRIVKFRTRLGGFVSIDQVGETFGLPDSTFNKIKPHLRVSSKEVVRLSLNHDSEAVFKAHPYFRWKMAKQLIAFRNQHGPFNDLNDLMKANWMNDSIMQKWRPYLKL